LFCVAVQTTSRIQAVNHVAIRRSEFVCGTRERPEVKVFTQTHQTRHPVPWGKVSVGDVVWMKWAGGPIVARSVVCGLRQIDDCTSTDLRTATAGSLLASSKAYFDSLPPAFAAVVVHLAEEQWLEEPFIPAARTYSESWVVLDSEAKLRGWLTPSAAAAATQKASSNGRRTRTISNSVRFSVLRRDGFACTYCGRKAPEVKLHVDHVLAWSRGGDNTADNLRSACEACNLGKGSRTL